MRLLIVAIVAGCGDPCAPERIAAAPATHVAVDAGDVFWAEPGAIRRATPSGGDASVAVPRVGAVGGLAARAGVVYWTGERVDDGGAVVEIGVFAGETLLATLPACPFYPNVALDGDVAYAASFACEGSPPELVAVPLAGGAEVRTTLASAALRIVAGDGAAQLVVGDSLVAIAAAGGEPTVLAGIVDGEVLARDAGTIYTTSGTQVLAVPASGGAPAVVALLAARAEAGTVAGGRVFVVADGQLAVAGRDPIVAAATDALASDDVAVYWADAGVHRLPTCGAD